MMIYKPQAHIFWFSWWEWWTICNLKFLVLSSIWLTKFNYGLLKLKNMICILLIGHFYVEVFIIVEEVNKLFSFSRHTSYIFWRSKLPRKRKNTTKGLQTTSCCSSGPRFNFALRLKMRSHHTKIQFYTVMKIFNHEKLKHTNVNKLFLSLFICEFLMLYYCNFNVEIAIWTYGITLRTINIDLFVQIYSRDYIYNIIS